MKVIVGAGAPVEIGTTEETPTIGIVDYSRRVTDDFGVTTVVERGFSRRMSVRMALATDAVDGVQQLLASLRATSAQWIADDDFAWLKPTGFYKDFDVDLAVPPLSFCTLTVEGLAETETVADPGGDPAPEGAASTLQMLLPVAVTDAVLASSSVAVDDAPFWAAGATYPLGYRVVGTDTHRIFESLVAGNIGHDPASSPSQWVDVGPTNRWAMFDEALGTATNADSSFVVTLNAGAVGAVALLDVVGAGVQVEVIATGDVDPIYDRTIEVSGGAIGFYDLPGVAGIVRVTVAGGGTVSVGTLLIGDLVGLGITEASPTAGITDYSRKDVDDFGEVTIVERAWAKRMTAKALIRSDAVDVVADRIAAVRARPVLWIGDAGLDSLTVYGFFRDFGIEVGQTVSKLSLSIEGLSKAQPLQPIVDLSPLALRIDDVEAALARVTSDSFLGQAEKPQAVIDWNALSSQQSALIGRYTAMGSPSDITAFRDDAVAKFDALTAYLDGLAPDWTDATQDTPIDPAAYQAHWVDAYAAVAAFAAAVTGRSGPAGASSFHLEDVTNGDLGAPGTWTKRPTSSGDWDGLVKTVESYVGAASATCDYGTDLFVGLSTDWLYDYPSEDCFNRLDYSLHISGDGNTAVYRNGLLTTVLGANQPGTKPIVWSDGRTVHYSCGTLSYSHAVNAASERLYGVFAMYYPGQTMTGIGFAAAGPAGSDGAAGQTVALVKIYKRAPAGTPPALPTTTGIFDPASYAISGLDNGWTIGVPAANGQPLWVSAAPAIVTPPATTDSIAAGEWAGAVIDAQDGANGGNGTGGAVVVLHQRNNTGTPPAVPGSTLTFDLITGVLSGALGAWTQAAPDPAGGRYLFQTSAAALATAPATVDTIASGEWAAAKQIVKDGDQGDPGAPGAPGLTISADEPLLTVARTATGVIKAGQLPQTVHLQVLSGDVDVTADTSFSAATGTNATASNDGGGAYTLTSVSSATKASFKITATYAGSSIDYTVQIAQPQDGASASRQSADLGAPASGGSYVQIGSVDLVVANGATINASGSLNYAAVDNGIGTRTVTLNAYVDIYNLTDTGTPVNGDAQTGSQSSFIHGDGLSEVGSVSAGASMTNSTGAPKTFRARFYTAKASGNSTADTTAGAYSGSMEITAS